MKWKVKQPPKIGYRREKIRFAFFPVKIGQEWLWLEKYKLVYTWTKNARVLLWSIDCCYLDDWVKSRELI